MDYQDAIKTVDRLATLRRRTRRQDGLLDSMTILVEKHDADRLSEFDARHEPVERLNRLLENHEMTASDLGNRALGAAILRGDRSISKANAIRLGDHFKMSPAAFLKA